MNGGVGRLKRRAEFLRVAAARRKWVADGLILQAAAAESGMDAMPRIGFTVTKRLGNAVARNRARRRLRAAAKAVMPHAAGGHDYVLIGRNETAARPFPLLIGDLETALRRLRLWRPTQGDA